MITFDTKVRLNNERIRKLQAIREATGMSKQAIIDYLIDEAFRNLKGQ